MSTQRTISTTLLNYGTRSLIALLALLLLPAGNALAGAGGDGDTDCDPGVPVRAKVRFTNNTGMTANDFHFYVYQNDKPHVVVNGATASSSSFSSVGVGLGTDDGTDSPPPGNHGAQVDMSGGTVPPGGTVTVEIMLCMNERNSLKFKDIDWTFDGTSLDKPKPSPKGGWRVKRPFPGGDGGKPGDPSGGGAGAQEGNGGGNGNWVHIVCIENDSLTDCMYVGELKLLASDTTYADVDTIDWDAIAPVENKVGQPPVLIPPGGKWCYNFETTGAYLGGHIYMNYDAEVVDCGGGGAKSIEKGGAGADGAVFTIGDHPNPELSLDLDEDGLWDSWEDVHGLRIDDNGGTDPDNGPFGDQDEDLILNEEEQNDLTDPNDPDDPLVVRPGLTVLRTLFCEWNFAAAPIPPGFFGPGSDPFIGNVQFDGLEVLDPPCPPVGPPLDTIIERLGPTALPGVGDGNTVPIEIVALGLVSTNPITVTFNGGQNPQLWDMQIEVDPEGTGGSSHVEVYRTNLNGGFITTNSFFAVEFDITLIPQGGGDSVLLERQLQLNPVHLDQGKMPFRTFAPELGCPSCTGGFHPGVNGGVSPFYIQNLSQGFQQCVQISCDFVPLGTGDIPGGDDSFTAASTSSYDFGGEHPAIPADFFNPGSDPFEGRIYFQSNPPETSPFCETTEGLADTIIGRMAPAGVPNPGDSATVPIEMLALSLTSVEPIVVGGGGGTWDVHMSLTPELHSSGNMTITRTHADGGIFDAALIVFPVFTFVRVDSASPDLELDGAESGFFSYIHVEHAPWIDDATGLGPVCADGFVPGVLAPSEAFLTKSVNGAKSTITFTGGACTLTLGPVDLSGDTDGDGLTAFDEEFYGTDASDSDSDNDGLSDGAEVLTHGTNPNDIDSDDDGDSDAAEIGSGTDPNNILDPSGVWVDFGHNGAENGAHATPFGTLGGAVAVAGPGANVRIKGNTGTPNSHETLTINSAMRLKAAGGTIRIGLTPP